MRAGAVSVAHGAPLRAMARRARTRRPWREVGRPRPCVALVTTASLGTRASAFLGCRVAAVSAAQGVASRETA